MTCSKQTEAGSVRAGAAAAGAPGGSAGTSLAGSTGSRCASVIRATAAAPTWYSLTALTTCWIGGIR
jgi:hypothetical protein